MSGAEWGKTFNLGDTLKTIATLERYRRLNQADDEEEAYRQQELEQSGRLNELYGQEDPAVEDVLAAGGPVAAKQYLEYKKSRQQYEAGPEGPDPEELFKKKHSLQSAMLPELYRRAKSAADPEAAFQTMAPGYNASYRDILGEDLPVRSFAELKGFMPDEADPEAELAYKKREAFETTSERERAMQPWRDEQVRMAKETAANRRPGFEQGKAQGFYERMKYANEGVESLERGRTDKDGKVIPGSQFTPGKMFAVGELAGIPLEKIGVSRYAAQGDVAQSWARHEDEFVNALLRSDTGSNYKDQEVADLKAQFFPRYGDSRRVRQDKANARRGVMDAVAATAGMREAGQGPVDYSVGGDKHGTAEDYGNWSAENVVRPVKRGAGAAGGALGAVGKSVSDQMTREERALADRLDYERELAARPERPMQSFPGRGVQMRGERPMEGKGWAITKDNSTDHRPHWQRPMSQKLRALMASGRLVPHRGGRIKDTWTGLIYDQD